ncbi:MAG: histidinol-phosphate transaminase [Proteobacteria bacterium]|nr:histidinol-phosphate transaminase [Pseudomonadota bacterium]NOG61307.1 histidinol-phosphate transaminase [Pseudomonadota bacterium]
MSCDLLALATKGVAGLQPYSGGKPIEELERELGLDEIIKLASNENPLGPSQKVLDIIASTKDLSRYPDGNGFSLKKALAEKHDVEPEKITLGNGSNDVLEMVARAFVTTEHQVIYSQHSFAVYPIVTQAVGAEHVVVPANDWGNDLPAMLEAITDKTRLIFVANPNNPTGTWVNRSDLKNFLENVPEHVLVLLDEAYFEYAISEANYPDSSLWLDDFKNLIVTRTFSKAYGLAGLRIGYALSHPDIANLLNRVRQPFNNNSLALVAAETALQDTHYILHSVGVNHSGMKQLTLAFDDMGLEFIPSKGNFICVDFEQPADAIYDSLLKSGVIVRPVANYGMPNHLRVSVGLESENKKFIDALGKILAK